MVMTMVVVGQKKKTSKEVQDSLQPSRQEGTARRRWSPYAYHARLP